jgi:CheY-like chemotaxis protein
MVTVLIADPDEDTRKILMTMLRYMQFDVLEASTAEAAQQLYRSQPVDLMVMNYPLRLANGVTLTRALKKSQRYHGIPVLNFTSRVTPEAAADAAADGANVTVAKPAPVDAVVAVIRRLLR